MNAALPSAERYSAIVARTRAILAERFPHAILPKGSPHAKRPLKIGIRADIRAAAPDLPAKHVVMTLRDYCGGSQYLRALKVGAARIDLQGQPAGVVTDAEATRAAAILSKRAAKRFPAHRAEAA